MTACPPNSKSAGPSIGDLTHRLRIEAPIRTPDDAGGVTLTWALIGEVYANIRSISGTERLEDDRLAGGVTHAIWLRHRAELTSHHRLLYGTRIFEIRAILDRDGRHRFVECRCEEVTS